MLVERTRVLIWFIADTFHMLVFPFLWLTAYGDRDTIHGFTREDTMTYFILIIFLKVASVSHSDETLTRDIQKGELNMHLLRPVPRLLTLAFQEAGYKMMYSLLLIPLVLVIVLFFPQWIVVPHEISRWILTVIAALVGFGISEMIAYLVGCASFWMTDSRPVSRLVYFTSFIFSGRLAPLEFFPETLRRVAEVLPFQFWASFPALVFTDHLETQEIFAGFLQAALWIALLSVFVAVAWRRGLRRYEGIGI